MPLDLDKLVGTIALGTVTARVAIGEIVAEPGFAPREWQSPAPPEAYGKSGHKPPVAASPDLARITALARREQVVKGTERGNALVEYINGKYRRDRTLAEGACDCETIAPGHGCITALNVTQCWALHEMRTSNGLLGPIGVGHGKTLLDLLAPLAIPNCVRAVLLVPPSLVKQLHREYRLLRNHFKVPSFVSQGGEYATEIEPGAPELHVFPYSRLSRPESTVRLEELAPDLIIADEAHKLRHVDTATTARVMRYFERHEETTRFCGWSGSLTDASISDYAHLSALALRFKSPLPLDPEVVLDWARHLDPNDWPAPEGALVALCYNEGGRVVDGFHRRLVLTEGVVSTTEPATDCELNIEERAAPAIPYAVMSALDELRETWKRPDGEELIDALSVSRCALELACGFYYRWKFPRGESVALILEWLNIRALYRKELRAVLRARKEHLDSPFLCEMAAKRHHGDAPIVEPKPGELPAPIWESDFWPHWRDIRGKVQPETEPVWIDEFLAEDAAAWAREHRGIVWYGSDAFGSKVSQISGLPKHGGGADSERLILAASGETSIIASLKSHGTGRDGLQRKYHEMLIAQPESSATGWEQVLGRLARIGQMSPIVTAWFYRHTEELAKHVDTALARALYVQTTLGSKQKLRTGFLDESQIETLAMGAGRTHIAGDDEAASELLRGIFDSLE